MDDWNIKYTIPNNEINLCQSRLNRKYPNGELWNYILKIKHFTFMAQNPYATCLYCSKMIVECSCEEPTHEPLNNLHCNSCDIIIGGYVNLTYPQDHDIMCNTCKKLHIIDEEGDLYTWKEYKDIVKSHRQVKKRQAQLKLYGI